jgi:hypothetical protein
VALAISGKSVVNLARSGRLSDAEVAHKALVAEGDMSHEDSRKLIRVFLRRNAPDRAVRAFRLS